MLSGLVAMRIVAVVLPLRLPMMLVVPATSALSLAELSGIPSLSASHSMLEDALSGEAAMRIVPVVLPLMPCRTELLPVGVLLFLSELSEIPSPSLSLSSTSVVLSGDATILIVPVVLPLREITLW